MFSSITKKWSVKGRLVLSGPFVASPGAIAVACELYVFLTVFAHTYWRRQWHPTPVLLPGKSHGWRSLVGCSPWGRKESDTTERLPFHFSLFTFLHWRRKWQPTPVFLPGESQGRGSLVAAVYGVTQSWTRLKRLSSSSSSTYIHTILSLFSESMNSCFKQMKIN